MKYKMRVLTLFIVILLVITGIEVYKLQMEQSIYFIRSFGILATYGIMLIFGLLYAFIRWMIDQFKKKRRK